MKNISSFKILNDEELTKYLASHYPEGRAWALKHDSSSYLYKFILCLAAPFKYIFSLINILAKNTDINQADELLEYWEKDSGIPDIFPRLDTIAKRKEAVNRIQSKISVYNVRDEALFSNFLPAYLPMGFLEEIQVGDNNIFTYENYIKKVLDMDVIISLGANLWNTANFPLKFPVKFGVPWKERQYTLYVSLPDYEYPYDETLTKKLDKVLDFIIPAQYMWVYS